MSHVDKINKKLQDEKDRLRDIQTAIDAVQKLGARQLTCEYGSQVDKDKEIYTYDHKWFCYKVKVKKYFMDYRIKYRKYFFECEKCKYTKMEITKYE